jgi:hypothetical protein
MKDFNLEPSNVDNAMADKPGEQVQDDKIDEEDDTEVVLAQEVDPTNPSDQA